MTLSAEALASLKVDLSMEHAAILQYAIQGFKLRDAGLTDPVRKIAREEMWHFEWLAEALGDRQSDPVLDRAEVFTSASIGAGLLESASTEAKAIEHYGHTLELVGDSDTELAHLIERIVDDERHHQSQFEQLAADVARQGEPALAPRAIADQQDLPTLGATVAIEYAALLQHLFNKYGCADCEQAEDYFDFAVEDMRHMSWLATYLPGIVEPLPPAVPTDTVRPVHSPPEARAAADEIEAAALAFYPAKIGDARGVDVAGDLGRALQQHKYRRWLLDGMG